MCFASLQLFTSTEGTDPLREGRAMSEVRAEMTGNVSAVHVVPGETVAVGDALVTLESMKMEFAVSSPMAGVVRDVLVAPNDQVGEGDVLAVIDD